MIRIALIIIVLLSQEPAYAEWVALEKHYQPPTKQTVYFDPDTIRWDGVWVSVWQLTNTKWMGEPPTPRFLSAKTHKQFDCTRARFRVLAVIEFSRQMATGKSSNGYIENGSWQPVKAQTAEQGLWEAACRKP